MRLVQSLCIAALDESIGDHQATLRTDRLPERRLADDTLAAFVVRIIVHVAVTFRACIEQVHALLRPERCHPEGEELELVGFVVGDYRREAAGSQVKVRLKIKRQLRSSNLKSLFDLLDRCNNDIATAHKRVLGFLLALKLRQAEGFWVWWFLLSFEVRWFRRVRSRNVEGNEVSRN